MRTGRSAVTVAVAAVVYLAATHAVVGQQSPDQVTVKFSDPGRTGTVEVNLIGGGITVKGVNRPDVLVDAHPRAESGGGRIGRRGGRAGDPGDSTGLRRLTQQPGFSIEEERNVISVSAMMPRAGDGIDFDLQVPLRTNLRLASVNGGAIVVSDVEGEIEVNNVNGPVTLTNVAGSAVAHSVNGTVAATLARVTADKPMSFTSLNGNVDVTLPASVKATFKLRSDQGDVFTDFDLQTRPQATPTVQPTGQNGGKYRIDVNKAIYGIVNGGGPEFEMRTFNGNVYVRKGR